MNYHVIDRWKTAASEYPRESVGEWSITTRQQGPGLYRMQDEDAFYYHADPIDLTVLKEGDLVWFTDEPRQMYALAEIGLFRAYGNVVVGGLGLGLIHHFLKMNPQVNWIVTIERAPELQELIWPHMFRGQLITGDFYDVLPGLPHVDTIITDFIFGYQGDRAWDELEKQREFCRKHFPDAQFLEHGYQRKIDAEVVNAAIPPSPFKFDQTRIFR